jgi:hypothetical protein
MTILLSNTLERSKNLNMNPLTPDQFHHLTNPFLLHKKLLNSFPPILLHKNIICVDFTIEMLRFGAYMTDDQICLSQMLQV